MISADPVRTLAPGPVPHHAGLPVWVFVLGLVLGVVALLVLGARRGREGRASARPSRRARRSGPPLAPDLSVLVPDRTPRDGDLFRWRGSGGFL